MKKLIALTISFLLVFSITANAITYYDYKDVKTIGDGVTLTKIKRFETNGWQNINIIKADLSVSHIKAELLSDDRGTSYLNNILNMAKEDNSIAAINSDFFSWKGDGTARGTPVGIMANDNKLISSSGDKGVFASLAIDNNGNIITDYLTTEITITAPNGQSRTIKHLNKYDPLDKIVIYTRDFDKMSGGSKNNVLEIVVENDIITKILKDQDPVEIPENGYVIRHLPEFDSFLVDNFKVGDKVVLETKTSFDLNNIKTIAGGGTLLVKNGQKAPITHNVSGVNPRTAAGTDITGKILYLITVDGRQENSVGMTLSQLQDFMIQTGVYNGINFDGGGSTTMVARDKLENVPSDGSLRNVAVGLQVKSDAPKGELGGFEIGCDDTTVFSGLSRKFYVTGAYDIYRNPYDGEIPGVTWEIDSNYGYFENNILKTTSTGKGITVTARYGDATGSMLIDIVDPPVYISPAPSHFYIDQQNNPVYNLTGKNEFGYSALIEPSDVLTLDKTISEIGYKEITVAGSKSYITFSGPHTDTFEGLNGKASAFPSDTASANYAMTYDKAKSGYQSGKLFFDFTNSDSRTKAAYLNFNQAKSVPQGTSQIGVWVYSQFPSYQWLRAEFTDKNGQIQRVSLADSINFTGWKFLTAQIRSDFEKLTKLYVVQNDYHVNNSGYLLFDCLTFIKQKEPVNLPTQLINVKPVSQEKTTSDYTFTVMGGFPQTKNLLTNLFNVRTTFAINNVNADSSWFLGSLNGSMRSNIKGDVKQAFGYQSFVNQQGQFISIDNSNNGISNTDKKQWDYLNTDLQKEYENLFIFMPINEEYVTDKRESKLFKDMISDISKNKNVYIFYGDKADISFKENNITYVSLSGIQPVTASIARFNIENYMYAKVTISNMIPTLTFEKIY